MKKVILLAMAVVMAAGISAQKVAPLNITLVEFDLEQVKAENPQNTYYLGALEQLQKRVSQDKASLDLASSNLKTEKKHYSETKKLIASRKKDIQGQQKDYKNRIKTLKKERKEIEKEKMALLQNTEIDRNTQQENLKMQEVRSLRKTEEEADCSTKIELLNHDLQDLETENRANEDYNYQLKEKENQLKRLISQNKVQASTLKNEIKATKNAIKAESKEAEVVQKTVKEEVKVKEEGEEVKEEETVTAAENVTEQVTEKVEETVTEKTAEVVEESMMERE